MLRVASCIVLRDVLCVVSRVVLCMLLFYDVVCCVLCVVCVVCFVYMLMRVLHFGCHLLFVVVFQGFSDVSYVVWWQPGIV